MSSGLRTLADPGLYYVSVDSDTSPHYTLASGKWTDATANFNNKVFKDLGKTVYYHPVDSLPASGTRTAPPVDVRKVAELTSTGMVTGTVYYIPLGTRVRGLKTQQHDIPSCWVAQIAAGVASMRSGAAASGSA